ncbi:hypothetical protein MMC26_005967 [Xylographa opegraphella]|nr:hypothetical protein [Xylographa opegraphella]
MLNARKTAHETIVSSTLRSFYLEDEHKALHDVTARVFPECVTRYISHRRMVISLTNQIRLLQLHSSPNTQRISSNPAAKLQHTLKQRLPILMDEMNMLRNTCLQASHPLYEIDQILTIAQLEDPASSTPQQHRPPHHDMLAIRKSTLDSPLLLHSWTTTRDRINNWLLHSLRADDQLAPLHRSILGAPQQHLSEQAWARLVLKHWTLDDAATGGALSRAQSAAATNSVLSASTQSLDFWTCNESVAEGGEMLTHGRLGLVKVELDALRRQHHWRLYRAFVDSGSSEEEGDEERVGLEMR